MNAPDSEPFSQQDRVTPRLQECHRLRQQIIARPTLGFHLMFVVSVLFGVCWPVRALDADPASHFAARGHVIPVETAASLYDPET